MATTADRSWLRYAGYAAAAMLLTLPACANAITCTASAGSLPFGQYNGVTKVLVTVSNTISISCTGPGTLTYVVSLSAGQSGTNTARYMASGTNRLTYQVYKDSARTQIFGDGNGGTYTYANTYSLTSGTTTLSATIYGAVAAGQAAAPGSYTDTLTMLVSY